MPHICSCIFAHFSKSCLFQWWWIGEHGWHVFLHPDTIRNSHRMIMITGSVADTKWSPLASWSPDVETIWQTSDCSPRRLLWQAARNTGMTVHVVCSTLRCELKFYVWKQHYEQQLFPEDCNQRKEYAEIMLWWLEEWPCWDRGKFWVNILISIVVHTGRCSIHFCGECSVV